MEVDGAYSQKVRNSMSTESKQASSATTQMMIYYTTYNSIQTSNQQSAARGVLAAEPSPVLVDDARGVVPRELAMMEDSRGEADAMLMTLKGVEAADPAGV